MHVPADAQKLELEGVPDAVVQLVKELENAGHEAYLVGGCVRDLLGGAAPADFDVATSAEPEEVLERFPCSIPTGLRHGTVMVPSESGPVDVTSYRAGPRIEDDLAHRDFTLNALAYHPARCLLIDPFDGRADLAKGRLRAVGSARERLAEDPLRALRAARLTATLGLEVDRELEPAMADSVQALDGVARERVRHELSLLLLAPGAAAGLELLRRTRIEQALAPRAAADAPHVVGALPADLELRLAGWLRGARAVAILRHLRFSRRVTERVERLLREHPVERSASRSRDVSLRRLLKRVGKRDVPRLITLRRAELLHGSEAGSEAARRALAEVAELERAVERVLQEGRLALRRHDLAIDGEEVMRLLGLGPGPEVGRTLRYLADRALKEPAANTPERLRELLAEWARSNAAQSGKP